jgi:hypothetical protein
MSGELGFGASRGTRQFRHFHGTRHVTSLEASRILLPCFFPVYGSHPFAILGNLPYPNSLSVTVTLAWGDCHVHWQVGAQRRLVLVVIAP